MKVDPSILAKYPGIYVFVDENGKELDGNDKPVAPGGKPDLWEVTLSGEQLVLVPPGAGGKIPLTTESDVKFSVGGQPIEFVTDSQGMVTHFVLHIVEGDRKAIRKGNLP